MSELWKLRLRDAPGSLERVLSTLRRRQVRVVTLAAQSAEGARIALELRLVLPSPDEDRERLRAELRGLADVEEATGPSP